MVKHTQTIHSQQPTKRDIFKIRWKRICYYFPTEKQIINVIFNNFAWLALITEPSQEEYGFPFFLRNVYMNSRFRLFSHLNISNAKYRSSRPKMFLKIIPWLFNAFCQVLHLICFTIQCITRKLLRAKTYSEFYQTSKMEFFEKTVNFWSAEAAVQRCS